MDRSTVLNYQELFRELGFLFEDQEIPLLLRNHLEKSFHSYDLGQLFKVYKLISHNFYRDDPILTQIIEDAVKIRAKEAFEQ